MTSTQKFIYIMTFFSISFISGCSTSSLNDYISLDRKTSITTIPAGARVIVDGKEVGTTPMKDDGESIFPPHWQGAAYMVRSKLEIKKNGCRTDTRMILDPIPKEIFVTLFCHNESTTQYQAQPAPAMVKQEVKQQPVIVKETYVAPKPQAKHHVLKETTKTPAVLNKDAEHRLMEIKKLYSKGLISDSENTELRQNILKDL